MNDGTAYFWLKYMPELHEGLIYAYNKYVQTLDGPVLFTKSATDRPHPTKNEEIGNQ